nr:hypothetical protein [Campylobacter troglodytis]
MLIIRDLAKLKESEIYSRASKLMMVWWIFTSCYSLVSLRSKSTRFCKTL